MIPIYRTALSRAIKVGIIDSGVSMSGGCGIIANSTADIALETFRSVAGLKDEIVRLMLPSEVSGTSVFGQYHPSLFNDAIRIQAISLIEVSSLFSVSVFRVFTKNVYHRALVVRHSNVLSYRLDK